MGGHAACGSESGGLGLYEWVFVGVLGEGGREQGQKVRV